MATYITLSSIIAAAERIKKSVIRPPTVLSPGLSDIYLYGLERKALDRRWLST